MVTAPSDTVPFIVHRHSCFEFASFFFNAIARAVVNHDGEAGTPTDPMVWWVEALLGVFLRGVR